MADTKENLIKLLKLSDACLCNLCGEEGALDVVAGVIADNLIANGVTVADNNVGGKWIPVTERLPEPETEVLILAERKTYSFKGKETTYRIVTTGMYEDGSKNTEDSDWVWETDGFEYDEELDAYIIPEGWWEWKHYIDDECHNYAIDDVVTHWMPLRSRRKTNSKLRKGVNMKKIRIYRRSQAVAWQNFASDQGRCRIWRCRSRRNWRLDREGRKPGP